MTFSTLKTRLKELPCGKKLNHSLYIIEESLKIVNEQLYKFVADLKNRAEAGVEYNVIKFFTNEFKIFWVSYPDRVERERIVEDFLIHILGGESIPLAPNPLFYAAKTGSVPPPGCTGGFSTTPSISIRNCFQKFS